MHDVRQKLTKCRSGFADPAFVGGGLGRSADFLWQLDTSAVVLTSRGKETTHGGC